MVIKECPPRGGGVVSVLKAFFLRVLLLRVKLFFLLSVHVGLSYMSCLIIINFKFTKNVLNSIV